MFFQSCFLSDFIIDCLFLFRGLFFILLFFYSLFFILYSVGVAFLFLLFLTLQDDFY
ncbi:putative membrane protein [Helicobacter pylori Hp P-3]|nr:putative membrane protein [Helicobacter pylori Hp P-3]